MVNRQLEITKGFSSLGFLYEYEEIFHLRSTFWSLLESLQVQPSDSIVFHSQLIELAWCTLYSVLSGKYDGRTKEVSNEINVYIIFKE